MLVYYVIIEVTYDDAHSIQHEQVTAGYRLDRCPIDVRLQFAPRTKTNRHRSCR